MLSETQRTYTAMSTLCLQVRTSVGKAFHYKFSHNACKKIFHMRFKWIKQTWM